MASESSLDIENIHSCISLREQLVERVSQLVSTSSRVKPSQIAAAARELVSLSKDLREIGIKCVNRIVSWTIITSKKQGDGKRPIFLWKGQEYLCKMFYDLDFVALGISPSLEMHGNFSVSDPLFIKKMKSVDLSSHRAYVAATLIILDAVAREKKEQDLQLTTISADSSPNQTSKIPFLFKRENSIGSFGALSKAVSSFMNNPRKKRADSNLLNVSIDVTDDSKHTQSPMHFQSDTRGYSVHGLLGQGAYAKVYECTSDEGKKYAVKIFHASPLRPDNHVFNSHYIRTCVTREISFLRELSHPCIIGMEDIIIEKDEDEDGEEKGNGKDEGSGSGSSSNGSSYSEGSGGGGGGASPSKLSLGSGSRHMPHIVMELMSGTLRQIHLDRMFNSSSDTATDGLPLVSSPNHHHHHALPPPTRPHCNPQVESLATSILVQLLNGVAYLHSKNIVHRDLKPDNILLNPINTVSASGVTIVSYTVKITDLGSARMIGAGSSGDGRNGKVILDSGEYSKSNSNSSSNGSSNGNGSNVDLTYYVGSRSYRAPEMLGNGSDYGSPVDVWSLGCVIYELVTGSVLHEGNNEQEVLDSILLRHSLLPYPLHRALEDRGLSVNFKKIKKDLESDLGAVSPPFRQLLEGMLRPSHQEREVAHDILETIKSWTNNHIAKW